MAGLDINAPYNSSKHEEQNGEFMTVGHKLSLDIVHLAHRPATAKLEGIKAMLERGLDTNTTWREGRASGGGGGGGGGPLCRTRLFSACRIFSCCSCWISF